jgi:hypothetical protein
MHFQRRLLEFPVGDDRAKAGTRRRDVGDPSLIRVFDRRSVFRLGLSGVFVRASVGGLTGHSAISQEFPTVASSPPMHDICLRRPVGPTVGYAGGVVSEATAMPTAQMNAANSRATAVMATFSSLPARRSAR